MVHLFPLSLYEGDNSVAHNSADRCLLPHYLWERIMNDISLQTHDLYLMEFSNETKQVTLSVGGGHHDDDNIVFVPQWVFRIFQEGESARYKPLRTIPPNATKITIKPLDSLLYHVDINEEVSRYLSDWHVLQEGILLEIHLQSIDYNALMYIEALEPGPLVLLRGEVPLEVVPQEEENPPPLPNHVQVPPPVQNLPQAIPDCFFGPMVPVPKQPQPYTQKKPLFPDTGRRLCDP